MQSDPTPVRLVDKYRPRPLADVRGQPWVTEQLDLWLKAPAPTAFIFAGGTGTGKTSTAMVLAAELGVVVDEGEMGGLYQIASGEQTGESVRNSMRALACRPFMGSGWRVLIVNEADHMTANAAQVWLDALEHIPPKSVVIFTTNSLSKMPRRFRDRCEVMMFEAGALLLRPHLEKFAAEVWKRETGRNDCPPLEDFGPIGDECGDASFRRLLQQMEPVVRQVKAGKPRSRPAPKPTPQPAAPGCQRPAFLRSAVGGWRVDPPARWGAGVGVERFASSAEGDRLQTDTIQSLLEVQGSASRGEVSKRGRGQ